MIPWRLLDTATVPGGEGSLRLMQRGAEFSIRLDRYELMNSRLSGSEEVLAAIACDRLKSRQAPRVLIGGLGMGFTLRAALASLGPDARVTVAELVPAVIKWAGGPMTDIFGDSLADPRVSIREADVGELIRSSPSHFDAILLDVDNGPDGLTRKANDALYDLAGLRAAHRALRAGGALAIWSAKPDPNFTARLGKANFAVDVPSAGRPRARREACHLDGAPRRSRKIAAEARGAGREGRGGEGDSPVPASSRARRSLTAVRVSVKPERIPIGMNRDAHWNLRWRISFFGKPVPTPIKSGAGIFRDMR